MPEFLKVRFEADDRVIGTAPVFFGVVSDFGVLLFAVNRNDNGVDVEYQTVPFVGQGKKLSAQAVVQTDDLADVPRHEPCEQAS